MNTPLVVGHLYVLVGGYVLRYQGPYGRSGGKHSTSKRHIGAFRPPSHGLVEPACGYSANVDDVLYEITSEHLPMLQHRIQQLEVRQLSSEEERFIIEELNERQA